MRRFFQEIEFVGLLVSRRVLGFERGLTAKLLTASSTLLARVLRHYGARIAPDAKLHSPLVLHNAERTFQNLSLGEGAYVGRDCLFDLKNRIEIGARATLAMRVTIVTHIDVGRSSWADRGLGPSNAAVIVGEDAYIGVGAVILPGVRIGAGALVGASALVRHDVPPGVRVAGVPARPIDEADTRS